MASQVVPIHRTNANSSTNNKNDVWFNAFDFTPGQDENIRWLSRPNQQLVQGKYSQDTEKFRITFDVENFKAEQIKIYIQNHKLTISGVYEERSEGHFMQKQFERTFELPSNADVDSMASFITSAHMLVVEIPLNSTAHVDQLNINTNKSDQRRLSFSLNKYNTTDNQGLLPAANGLSNLSSSGQSIRRTSITKTTTTTTSGTSALPAEAAELLRNVDTTTGGSTLTYSKHTTDRHSSNTGNQSINNESNTSSSTNSTSTHNTNQTGVVPIKRGDDTQLASSTTTNITHSTNQTGSVPITRGDDTQSASSTTTNTTHSTNQTGSVPITRSNDTNSTLLNQQNTSISERRDLKTTSSSNQNQMYTLEEFLQNKTWNPSLVDGSGGKKILYMRLQMKPGTKSDQVKISLNSYDLRVEIDNKVTSECGRQMSSHRYWQVTLFSTCDVDQLKTELKEDGYLHVQVPIQI